MGLAGWAKSSPPECRGPLVPGKKLRECMGVLCTWVKLLTDLQILGCELHKNAFGPPAPAVGAIALPIPPSRYKWEGREEGKGNGWQYGEGGKGGKGWKWEGRGGKRKEGKGKGGSGRGRKRGGKGLGYLSRGPEFVVTLLQSSTPVVAIIATCKA